MKQTINFSQFYDTFIACKRQGHFSYDGLRALYDYLIQFEEDCGSEIELDVIALCCEWSEYENFEEFKRNYQCCEAENLEELSNFTQIIQVPNSDKFLILQF
jgi:hypothetical protein